MKLTYIIKNMETSWWHKIAVFTFITLVFWSSSPMLGRYYLPRIALRDYAGWWGQNKMYVFFLLILDKRLNERRLLLFVLKRYLIKINGQKTYLTFPSLLEHFPSLSHTVMHTLTSPAKIPFPPPLLQTILNYTAWTCLFRNKCKSI